MDLGANSTGSGGPEGKKTSKRGAGGWGWIAEEGENIFSFLFYF